MINDIETRIESDSIGEKEVPADAYYGVQTLRGKENFNISGKLLTKEFIKSMAQIKKAAAIVNSDAKTIDSEKANAIIQACDEIINGDLLDQFIVDPLQGGAGTSMNMNANEVIANRANEILGHKKGDYSCVHPNDTVNFGQSTNDVIPSAGKMTAYELTGELEKELQHLFAALLDKTDEFLHVIKMGRTQMQDAVPITLGQEFFAYADAVRRSLERIHATKEELLGLNMGGTAIGTGINTDINYFNNIVPEIAKITGVAYYQMDNLIDGTQHTDTFAALSSSVKNAALALSKIANDLRLLSSGPKTGFGEITLPSKQNGSSIMPGKVNPVIPEIINQVCFKICGNDVCISMAVEAGQLELNAFEPVMFDCLFESITILTNAINTFINNCVIGIKANEEKCLEHVNISVGIVTALCPHIGYKLAADIAKEALAKNIPVRDLILQKNILTKSQLDEILDVNAMTGPGIAGKSLFEKSVSANMHK